jgi:ABC-2 type transport system permease protein
MSGTVAIIRKEFKSYFYSPIAYVVLGVFLLMTGVLFAKFVSLYQQHNAAQRFGQGQGVTLDKVAQFLYQNMSFIICFLTPFLTMKLFAEERRQHTLELLFTSPIRGFELVLGKFSSALGLMTLMLATSLLYLGFMVAWGSLDLFTIGTTYLGLFLSIACYVSVGALISAFTSSQAIAAGLTFMALLFLWLLQSLGQGLPSVAGIELGVVMPYLSPLSHVTTFSQGLIHIKDVVYFITFTAFMLFLTNRVVESNRWR